MNDDYELDCINCKYSIVEDLDYSLYCNKDKRLCIVINDDEHRYQKCNKFEEIQND